MRSFNLANATMTESGNRLGYTATAGKGGLRVRDSISQRVLRQPVGVAVKVDAECPVEKSLRFLGGCLHQRILHACDSYSANQDRAAGMLAARMRAKPASQRSRRWRPERSTALPSAA